jgi:hypothetical protein
LKTGIGSGEGLIYAVRDMVTKQEEKNGKMETIIIDNGANSKNVLFQEPEFSRLLKAGKREGSTITECLRNSWYNEILEINLSGRSVRSTEYSIAMICHVTEKELTKLISDVDSSNGYLNRFLFCKIGAAESRPFPDDFDIITFSFFTDFISSMDFIDEMTNQEVKLSVEARSRYEEIFNSYQYRTEDDISDLVARSIPHLLKIAMIYALLDQSFEIRIPHLEAAKAIVDFSVHSVRAVFLEKTFNKNEQKLLDYLFEHNGKDYRSNILRNCFSNNISRAEMDTLIKSLSLKKLVIKEFEGDREVFTLNKNDFL